jgi:hypothetical protein
METVECPPKTFRSYDEIVRGLELDSLINTTKLLSKEMLSHVGQMGPFASEQKERLERKTRDKRKICIEENFSTLVQFLKPPK